MRTRLLPLLGCLAVACAAPDAPLDTRSLPIVGGEREAGYPAVGALALEEGGRYQGSFCTATLIDPRWALTAAHCVAGRRADRTLFYLGDDAVSRNGQRPPGRFVPVRRLRPHPQFALGAAVGLYDVALVELAEAVDDVAPIPLRRADLAPLRGEELVYVGFGVDDGVAQRGGGLKRRATLGLADLGATLFVSVSDGRSVCYGDSGGPALHPVDGGLEVVGINSSVFGGAPCAGGSIQVRVDAMAGFIDRTMGVGADCRAGDACECAAACGDNGVCDPLGCQAPAGCRSLIECLTGCNGGVGCTIRCFEAAGAESRARYEAVVACGAMQCDGAPDQGACLAERCPEPWGACLSDLPPGDADCGGLLACLGGCRDRACSFACYEDATADARAAYDGLAACVAEACAAFQGDPVPYNACANTACGEAWRACTPPDDCALTGGDCGAGAACLPATFGGRYCRASDDRALGAACDPRRVACADGAFCQDDGAGPRCQTVCTGPADCQSGQRCALIDDASEPFGTCSGCPDADGDGDCDATDCAPDDATRGPGQAEACDGRDADCDGRVDEGCGGDAGVVDAGAADAGPDAALLADAGPDASPPTPADATPTDATDPPDGPDASPADAAAGGVTVTAGGDGCRQGPGQPGGGLLLGLLLMALGWRRRRGASADRC